VTSVGFLDGSTAPIFTISGSPVTSSGTLTETLSTESANKVFAGPTTGSSAQPTFRSLVGADLPNPTATSLGGVESLASASHEWINTISTSGVPSATQPAFTDLSGSLTASQMPALTGDVTSIAGAVATTVAAIAGTTVSGTTGTTNVMFSASPTSTGTLTAATVSFSGNITGTKGSNFGFVMNGNASAPNFKMGNELNVSGLEFTPSTANGGSTYSNPALTITGLGSSASSTTTTITSANILFPNLTTGTNADTLCLKSDGTILIQAAACTISSRKYKENIFSLDEKSGLDEIMELRPVEFNFNKEKWQSQDKANAYRTQTGLIAEEVEKVDPRLAIYEDDGKTVKSYRQEAVISVLIKAIQEQQKEIEELRHGK